MELTDRNGQILGKKSLATREKLLDSLTELLGETTLRTIRPIDIARRAGTSPAAFYTFFADLDDAVLALAPYLTQDAALAFSDSEEFGQSSRRSLLYRVSVFFNGHQAVLSTMLMLSLESELFAAALQGVLDPVVDTLVATSVSGSPNRMHTQAVHCALWAYLAVKVHGRFLSDSLSRIAVELAFDDMVETLYGLGGL